MPVVQKVISWGITTNIATTFSILLGLFAALLILKDQIILAGIFIGLAGLSSFLNNILAKSTNTLSTFNKFYSSMADIVVDSIVLFAIIIYCYSSSYPLMLVTLLLLIIMNLNNHILALIKNLRLKRIEIAFHRPEFFLLLTLGLLFNQLTLFLLACLFSALAAMANLLLIINKQFSGHEQKRKRTKPKKTKKLS
jgi:phosphatidylglycerophosphate synthase